MGNREHVAHAALQLYNLELPARVAKNFVAPSEYLGRLEKGNESAPPISQEKLNSFLVTHLIDPTLLRSDDFEAFLADRQKRLLALIERALGKAAYGGPGGEEGEDIEYVIDDDATVTLAQ